MNPEFLRAFLANVMGSNDYMFLGYKLNHLLKWCDIFLTFSKSVKYGMTYKYIKLKIEQKVKSQMNEKNAFITGR